MRPNYNKTIDRLYVSQEFFWSKKEEPEEDKTGETLHKLWAHVRFYNKNMVKYYEQAMEAICKEYSKFLTWSVYGKKDYDEADKQNNKIMKWSKSLPKYFSTCQKQTEAIVKKDLGVSINNDDDIVYYITPSYPRELIISETDGYTYLSADWLDDIENKFKDPDSIFVKKILDIVNKEKSNMVPFDYKIKIPTFDKLVKEFIHSNKANDAWGDGLCDATTVIFHADDQGDVLRDPSISGYTEDKFNSDIDKLSNL